MPWLEPDVNDHLRALAAAGETAVVVFPIGFVSDHLEVIWDLDTEAQETAASSAWPSPGPATAGTHPAFVAVDPRAARGAPRRRAAAPGHELPGGAAFRPAPGRPRPGVPRPEDCVSADAPEPDSARLTRRQTGATSRVVPAAERREHDDDRRRHRRSSGTPGARRLIPSVSQAKNAAGDAGRLTG